MLSTSSHWRKPPGSALRDARVSSFRYSALDHLPTQKFEQIGQDWPRIIVPDHNRDEADMDNIEVAHKLGWWLFEYVPSVHIDVGWQPGLGADLVETDIKPMKLCGCWLIAGNLLKPDSGSKPISIIPSMVPRQRQSLS